MKRVKQTKAQASKKAKATQQYAEMSLSDAENVVQAGVSAALALAPSQTPTSSQVQASPRGQTPTVEHDDAEMKKEIHKLKKRLKFLEHKFDKGHALAEYVTPNETVNMADKVNEKTHHFQSLAGLTVAEVQACQDCFSEPIALNFGQNLATLYKVKVQAGSCLKLI